LATQNLFMVIDCLLCLRFVLFLMYRLEEAEEALRLVRSPDFDVSGELQGLIEMEKDENKHRTEEDEAEPTWAEVFACRKAVIIGIGLQLSGAFTGINTIMLYSATIFGFANVDDPVLAAAFVGIVNVMSTLVSVQLMDKHGRRTLLLSGTGIMSLSLVVLAVVLLFGNGNETIQGIISVFAILVFVFGFAIGLGAVSWVVMAEIMPTRLRTKAYGMFVSISYGCNLFIGLLTLTAIKQLGGVKASMDDDEADDANKTGVAYLYGIFAVISACSYLFISVHVPETKGKNPKDFMHNAEAVGDEEVLSPLISDQ
jgi:MFS family permease